MLFCFNTKTHSVLHYTNGTSEVRMLPVFTVKAKAWDHTPFRTFLRVETGGGRELLIY